MLVQITSPLFKLGPVVWWRSHHTVWKAISHWTSGRMVVTFTMGFAVRVRSAGQKYEPTCHQMDRADVTEFVTLDLVRLSSLGQHVGVLALAGYKRRKSALTAGPIRTKQTKDPAHTFVFTSLVVHKSISPTTSSKAASVLAPAMRKIPNSQSQRDQGKVWRKRQCSVYSSDLCKLNRA